MLLVMQLAHLEELVLILPNQFRPPTSSRRARCHQHPPPADLRMKHLANNSAAAVLDADHQ